MVLNQKDFDPATVGNGDIQHSCTERPFTDYRPALSDGKT